MGHLIIPLVETGKVSDGYHTFDELYAHRYHLFLCLAQQFGGAAFKTKKNSLGEELPGWFILGLNTRHGQLTYHLPTEMWGLAHGIQEIERNANYDGHSPADVLDRLRLIAVSGV